MLFNDLSERDLTLKSGDESNFSVFLSCVEGELYVDNILKRLRDKGIPCFTRHDSVVVASGYDERSEVIAKQVFKDFGFKYNHKVEDKFWDLLGDSKPMVGKELDCLEDCYKKCSTNKTRRIVK